MMYGYHVKIIVFSALMLFSIDGVGQNNAYKIKDNLYKYFKLVDANIASSSALKMADTLFYMAQKENDVKAQCIALYSRARHYNVLRDIDHQIVEIHKAAPFILKTEYKQYYFGLLNQLIISYINMQQYTKAADEINNSRKEALRYNNEYGIYHSYTSQASIYMNANHFRLALSYYRMAYDYGKSHHLDYVSDTYIHLARSYFYLSRWKECKEFIDLLMNEPVESSQISRIYAFKLSYDCVQMPIDSAKVESDYRRLSESIQRSSILPNDRFLYDEAMYYYYRYYKCDEQTASTYTSRRFYLPEYFDFLRKAKYYEACKDEQQAALYYDKYTQCIKDISSLDELYLADEFIPKLDFYNLEHEKNVLRKKNEQIKLREVKNRQMMLALNESKTVAKLISNQREHLLLTGQLKTQTASINQQNRLLKIKQLQNAERVKTAMMDEEKVKWQVSFALLFSIAVIIILGLYVLDKFRKRKQLKKEKSQAEKSNYIKSLFFQNMNHEIRTPLNAISGFNDLLNGEMSATLSSEEKKELIDMIAMNSDLLTTLVNDVIDLSNYESGTYKLHLNDVDLNMLCSTVVESIRGRENPGVHLAFKNSGDYNYTLHTDAQRLQQVLSNYLTNACKHTESGSIVLSYDVYPLMIRFAVTDTGCGVKEEDAEKVFKRFEMLDNKKSGTGLGLHICRLIANLLHGKAYLDTAYKKGARFIFDHPIVMALLMCLMMTFSTVKANAQNEYGLSNEYSDMIHQIETQFDINKGMPIANKMYSLAVRKKNVRAQCVALYAQCYYYTFANDRPNYLSKFEQCYKLGVASHYYEIVFDCWVNVISALLIDKDYATAERHLGELYKLAKNHNNKWGLGIYYYTAGVFYYTQHQTAAALFYLLQSIDYANVDKTATNAMLGNCYYKFKQYDKVINYCNKSLSYATLDVSKLRSLVMLLESYFIEKEPDKAQETFRQLLKLDKTGFSEQYLAYYYLGLSDYYHNIGNKEKAGEAEAKLLNNNNYFLQEQGKILYHNGNYSEALKKFKLAADEEAYWLHSDYKDLNNFYIGKFAYKEAMHDKDILEMSTVRLSLESAQHEHKLLMLKHENTQWLLRQEQLLAQNKHNKLKLQNILLAQKKSEYQKQNVMGQELKRQKESQRERQKWEYLTIFLSAILVLTGICIYIVRLRKSDKKLSEEAEKAKLNEEKKSKFYADINRLIREPIDTIISLNHKLNGDDNTNIPESERNADVARLDDRTSYLTDFINDLLDISKYESGTYVMRHDVCDVNALCKQAITATKHSEAISYATSIGGDANRDFTSDGQLILKSLTSLLQYAVVSTDDLDSIRLQSDLRDAQLVFSVSFAGAPIAEADAETIFDFSANANGRSNSHIGLYKSRLISQLLDGRVYADTSYREGEKLVMEMPI